VASFRPWSAEVDGGGFGRGLAMTSRIRYAAGMNDRASSIEHVMNFEAGCAAVLPIAGGIPPASPYPA
jgi:hypothetical protein